MSIQFSLFQKTTVNHSNQIVNVASVPQRSPFRYPGGKTWLIPTVRQWLTQGSEIPQHLIEPFAGGGIVSLTAAFENLAKKVTMVELDDEVAAVWKTVLNDKGEWLANKIWSFELTSENIKMELEREAKQVHEVAFCTLLKNRICHGGILAKGAGWVKHGEGGKGFHSRWYPKTLRDRILALNKINSKIRFIHGDAFQILEQSQADQETYFFIDPPYTVAGKRLYTHFNINHERLFALTANLKGKFLLTYDDTPEIKRLANQYQLRYQTIPMRTTHHLEKHEIIISDNFNWWN
jgi:DNA adenine methylase